MNQVTRLRCAQQWSAHGMLHALLGIEEAMGRVRVRAKGPRIIDLDLLLFNGQVVDSPDLIVPHPRMEHRAFVLVPLLDLAPDLAFPDGRPVVAALKKLDYVLAGQSIRQP